MKLLSLSDAQVSFINSPVISLRFRDVDLMLSCGDLPYSYLEYIVSLLNIPAYYVRGNHDRPEDIGYDNIRTAPWGAVDLHQRTVVDESGLILAGIEGSLRYNLGAHQYTQSEMWAKVFRLSLLLILNRLRYGRFLDIFLSHAPPWGIQDADDRPHQGFKAFRWFDKVFEPAVHLHGHIHILHPGDKTLTLFHKTHVMNTYRFREFEIDLAQIRARPINLN